MIEGISSREKGGSGARAKCELTQGIRDTGHKALMPCVHLDFGGRVGLAVPEPRFYIYPTLRNLNRDSSLALTVC